MRPPPIHITTRIPTSRGTIRPCQQPRRRPFKRFVRSIWMGGGRERPTRSNDILLKLNAAPESRPRPPAISTTHTRKCTLVARHNLSIFKDLRGCVGQVVQKLSIQNTHPHHRQHTITVFIISISKIFEIKSPPFLLKSQSRTFSFSRSL